tara:strand:+ start:10803 stop:11252 length:450 start_codon:yes stop_codon:yes gene_type:complete
MAKVKKGKEPTFAESIGLENLFSVRGKIGIYMLSGKPTKSGKWVRIYEINDFNNPIMAKIDAIRWLNDFKLPKLSKEDISGIPSKSYELTELLDRLHKWKDGKTYKPRTFGKTFNTKVIPLTPPDMVYDSELKKLVYFYNYFISHINKL